MARCSLVTRFRQDTEMIFNTALSYAERQLEVERMRRGKGGSKSRANKAATDADDMACGGARPLAIRLPEAVSTAKEQEPGLFRGGLSLSKHVRHPSPLFLGLAA
jgi:hypothetical protein